MNDQTESNATHSPILVEVLERLLPGPGRWQPHVGSETLGLLRYLGIPDSSQQFLLQEAVNILSRCVSPTDIEGRETGLVIGYVQSGKTMSFTTVAALAHDNGYPLIVIVAGTSVYLLGQSRDRLIRDLRLNNAAERRPWRHIADASLSQNSDRAISDVLEEWRDAGVPASERRSILTTVMKNHTHLRNLIGVLRNVDLRGVPTLIIDDEGDQASLNTRVRQGAVSTTYRRLMELKSAIPHHSYLQYTATPQAPLLINIVDVLSPSFAEVITPGDGYIGGADFFVAQPHLVREIPVSDIPGQGNAIHEPPQSLLRAMRLFFLGAAAHIVTGDPVPNRSMMVHPSQYIYEQGRYAQWVEDARTGWIQLFSLPLGDNARAELIELFRRDYDDLRETETVIPVFDDLTARLRHALLRTVVREINTSRGRPSPVNWNDNPYWIIVGGQAIDRGFTVEGLTVTYMPRGAGVGNADTIQQRGRFFGYKRRYRGYCRIFLEATVRDAFRRYVEHEEDVRGQLIEHRGTGRPLSYWRRQFFLTRILRPTRDAVIDIGYQQRIIGDSWIYPDGPHDALDVIEDNRSVFTRFREMLDFHAYAGLDRRRTEHRNLVAENVRLQLAHCELLTQLKIRRLEDSQQCAALLHVIQMYLSNHPDDLCTVFLMASGHPIRRGYSNDRIKELFQGRQEDRQGMTYPGDRAVRSDNGITVQLRYLTLGEEHAPPISENVPHVAVWVPAAMARDVLQQPQGGPRND